MGHSPLHLTAHDFDAYAPEKATSNAYSRPRLEVKQRALAWARGVVARLAELGIAVDVHGSDEHPSLRNRKRVDCQWVFFWRDAAARDELGRLLDRGRSIASVIDDPSPYTRHAFLALRLGVAAVEVCFAVHPEAGVDVDNLRARLSEAAGAEALTAELMGALEALPEQFTIDVAEGDRVAASAATPEVLRTMIERAAAGQVPIRIGWSLARDTAVEHTELLDDQLEDAIIALAPVYRLVAWSRENDHIALDRRIQSAEEDRARAHAAAEAETEKWRTERAEARRRGAEEAQRRAAPIMTPGVRRPSLDALFGAPPAKPAAPPRPLAPPPRAATPKPAVTMGNTPKPAVKMGDTPKPVVTMGDPPKPPAQPVTPGETAQAARPNEEPREEAVTARAEPVNQGGAPAGASTSAAGADKPGALDKGARVRVRSGAFADKVGVIGELDGRGGARVMLGLLSTRLLLSDLEAVVEGRVDRPALQSSHRKPLAPAPRKAR